jgi:glycosyltransferase involved in cell wall biosynthesis
MNILLFNATNPYLASGIVALNLFNEFKKNNHNVRLVTNNYSPDYPEGIISMESFYHSYWKSCDLRYKLDGLKRKLKLVRDINKDSKFDFFEFHEHKLFYKTKSLLKKAKINPDVIIILFAKKLINTKNIYELYEKTGAQIYWLMYDMAPLTGGCHYAWECKGYQNNCGTCPGLLSSDSFDSTYHNLLYKKKYIDKTKIHLIAASEWQFRQAKASSLFRDKKIHKILLSADPNVYKPGNKIAERLKIGLPATKKIIFFGAIELTEERKGMLYLLESLKIFKKEISNTPIENEILLLIAGREIGGIKDDLPFEYHYLGMLDNTGIAAAYRLADVFLCPSIEDSGPTMINQAIVSGTPVISFEMGVALDLVITGKTGYRAKIRDSYDLAKGLYNVLSMTDENFNELSKNCRELGRKYCEPETQIKIFEDMFKSN